MKFVIVILFSFATIVAQTNKDYFQVGMYGLQSPVGTKGYQNGKLKEIKNDIVLVKGNINSSMPMRSWNRKRYPNWDFLSFFANYMKDMYSFTKGEDGSCGIQSLTPSLYGVFVDPVMDGTNDNEKGFNRHISREIFKKFVFRVLDEEYNIVKEEVKSDSIIVEILTSSTKRPFLGWYLDDEPLIRNHDISAIIEMAWYIREATLYFDVLEVLIT